jgi:hypothetical protein
MRLLLSISSGKKSLITREAVFLITPVGTSLPEAMRRVFSFDFSLLKAGAIGIWICDCLEHQ